MMDAQEVKRWLGTIADDSGIAVSDGGLSIVEIRDGEETGAYLEIGGIPLAGDDEEEGEQVMGCPKCGNEWPSQEGTPCPKCGY